MNTITRIFVGSCLGGSLALGLLLTACEPKAGQRAQTLEEKAASLEAGASQFHKKDGKSASQIEKGAAELRGKK